MRQIKLLWAPILLLLVGCAIPSTFVRTAEPAWASVEVRDDLDYTKAWDALVDTLAKRFDMEILSKQDGYARTTWLYSWTGTINQNYRVRVTVKFAPDHKIVEVKSEAEFGGPGNWVAGYDSRLLETIKTDIMGKVGRTTR